MKSAHHLQNAHKVGEYITISKEGAYTLVLCPRELAHRLISYVEARIKKEDCFLAMGETSDDAILQTSAALETLEELRSDFVNSLTDEQLETFLERHPRLGPSLTRSEVTIAERS